MILQRNRCDNGYLSAQHLMLNQRKNFICLRALYTTHQVGPKVFWSDVLYYCIII